MRNKSYITGIRDSSQYLDQPSSDSGIEHHNGKDYVVLRNSYRVLRVYRILNNGALRSLDRYPRVFDKW